MRKHAAFFFSFDSCTMLTCWAGVGKTLRLLSLAWAQPEPLCEQCKAVAMETLYLFFCGVLLFFYTKRCVRLCGDPRCCCSSSPEGTSMASAHLPGQPRSAPLSVTPSRDPKWANPLNEVKAHSCSWTGAPWSSQLALFGKPQGNGTSCCPQPMRSSVLSK